MDTPDDAKMDNFLFVNLSKNLKPITRKNFQYVSLKLGLYTCMYNLIDLVDISIVGGFFIEVYL